jgi:hypothetical protein
MSGNVVAYVTEKMNVRWRGTGQVMAEPATPAESQITIVAASRRGVISVSIHSQPVVDSLIK